MILTNQLLQFHHPALSSFFPLFSSSWKQPLRGTWKHCCRTWMLNVPSDFWNFFNFSALVSVFIMKKWGEHGSTLTWLFAFRCGRMVPLFCLNCSSSRFYTESSWYVKACDIVRMANLLFPVHERDPFSVSKINLLCNQFLKLVKVRLALTMRSR